MQRHEKCEHPFWWNIRFGFGGTFVLLERFTLNLNVLQAVVTDAPVRLFKHLSSDCHPTATKQRRYSNAFPRFISTEVKRVFDEDFVEASTSPWHA